MNIKWNISMQIKPVYFSCILCCFICFRPYDSIHNWMAWCKTDISHSFWVKFFFFHKCLDLYMCFSKTFPCIFLPKLSKKKSKIDKKNFILFHLIPFIVYISICFCPRFSRKQSAITNQKKLKGNVLLLNWKAHYEKLKRGTF